MRVNQPVLYQGIGVAQSYRRGTGESDRNRFYTEEFLDRHRTKEVQFRCSEYQTKESDVEISYLPQHFSRDSYLSPWS